MATPLIPGKAPILQEAAAGTYAWCTCGRSKSQPFCDGAHGDTGFRPMIFKLDAPRRVAWCACKHSGKPPFCDGSHARLP